MSLAWTEAWGTVVLLLKLCDGILPVTWIKSVCDCLTWTEAVADGGVLSVVGVGGVHLDHLEAGLLLLPDGDDAVQRLQELRLRVVIVQHADLAGGTGLVRN